MPLRVEYAKSSRSQCSLKECSKLIMKGEVRIGTGVMMPGRDEYTYKWRHLCCFTARQLKNCEGVESIEGFDGLKEADQLLVHRMIKGELVGDSSVIGHGAEVSVMPSNKPVKNNKAKEKEHTTVAIAKRQRDPDCGSDTDDYEVEINGADAQVPRPKCPYGTACFRKNPSHFSEYEHAEGNVDAPHPVLSIKVTKIPKAHPASASRTEMPSTGAPEMCPFGALCFRTDPAHFKALKH